VPSARETLQEAIQQLGEEELARVLDLVRPMLTSARNREELTREDLRGFLGSQPGITVPPIDAQPFEDFEPVEVGGVPASELLVSDRR